MPEQEKTLFILPNVVIMFMQQIYPRVCRRYSRKKYVSASLTDKVSFELCSFTELEKLKDKGPYDMIFSNFAGLNCTNELEKVLRSFPALLNPGGIDYSCSIAKILSLGNLTFFKRKI